MNKNSRKVGAVADYPPGIADIILARRIRQQQSMSLYVLVLFFYTARGAE